MTKVPAHDSCQNFAYSVRQRTQEIGVRMALGATVSDIVYLMVQPGMRPLGIGL